VEAREEPQEKWQMSKSPGRLLLHHQLPPLICGTVQERPQEGGPEAQPVQARRRLGQEVKSQQEPARRRVTPAA
jgi:hypothetical protein